MNWEPSRRSAPPDLASAVPRVKREIDTSGVAPDIGVHVAKGVVVKHDPDDQSNKRTKSEEHEDDTTAPAAMSSALPVVDENKHREEWRKKYNIPPPPLAPPSAYMGQTTPSPPPAAAANVGRQTVGTTQQPYTRGNVSRDASRGATGSK